MEKEKTVSYSSYELVYDGNTFSIATKCEAERKYKNTKGKDSNGIVYFYRHDFDDDGKLIETYLLA
jgi:hypothetical protein